MKEIFVLGAGASHASAGTPLGKDLVWTYHQDCVLYHTLGSNGRRTNDSISEEQKDFKTLFDFLQSRPEFKKYANQLESNINEGVVSCFDVPKRYYIDELMKDLQKEDNSTVIKLIKQLTVKHITESSTGKELYREFGKYLARRSALDVSVISINFDCLLHEEFKNNNVYREVYFDYLIDFNNIADSRRSYNKKNGIPLLKLNGSLDWAYNLQTNTIQLLHWSIKPEVYYSNNNGMEPYIFLPYQTKDKSMQILLNRAKTELKQASKVTIIGYSFPDCDSEIYRELFKEIKDSIGQGIELEVVDLAQSTNEQEGIKTKYKKLFPNIDIANIAKVKFFFDGFEGYIEKIKEVVNGVVI